MTTSTVEASALQPISRIDPAQISTPTAGGDSVTPIISSDGRYVLFASTAANLVTNSNTPPSSIPLQNVFLRDRLNATTLLISVGADGSSSGNDNSLPIGISTDGRYVVFESTATNLVAGDTNGVSDVFVRDLQLGSNILVSVGIGGAFANGPSEEAAMTPDARYVTFVSAANNLLADDTNGIPDVFVRDLQNGSTLLVSVGSLASGVKSRSGSPEITPNGQYVAFWSSASNLVAGATNTQDVYVRDLGSSTTIWASSGAQAVASSNLTTSKIVCYNQGISADGRYLYYEVSPVSVSASMFPGLILRYAINTGATELLYTNAAIEAATGGLDIRNLDVSPDGESVVFVASTNGTSGATTCILLWDETSKTCSLVSENVSGSVTTNATCDWPMFDPSGQFVAFSSTATNLTTNMVSSQSHLYLRDLSSGHTTLLDVDVLGQGSPVGPFAIPSLSSNSLFVAFQSADSHLITNDNNGNLDVFVRDLSTGGIELISSQALPSVTLNGPSMISPFACSADSRYLAFGTEASNLMDNDTNGCRDIYVHDRQIGANLLASVNTNGVAPNGPCFEPAISADGRYVAFTSIANDLTPGDTNRSTDVFVRDLQTGTIVLGSTRYNASTPANTNSYSPRVSQGGRYLVFRSKASNLVAGSVSGSENLFIRDLQAGTNAALTTSGLTSAAITADGRFIAFSSNTVLRVWDTTTASSIYSAFVSGSTNISISPDGARVAYWSGSLRATHLGSNTTHTITANALASRPGLRFSSDNRYFVYATKSNGTNQIYRYDFQTSSNLLVSFNNALGMAGNQSSDSPDISSDGRWIVYRSNATNLAPGDNNNVTDIYLFDALQGTTMRLSSSRFGGFSANNRSLNPLFTPDGRAVLFQTWASDLSTEDFNQTSDVVAYEILPSTGIPLFSATIYPGSFPGEGPFITWPVVEGAQYHIEFKDDLNSGWLLLNAQITISGNLGSCRDMTQASSSRFYRVVGER